LALTAMLNCLPAMWSLADSACIRPAKFWAVCSVGNSQSTSMPSRQYRATVSMVLSAKAAVRAGSAAIASYASGAPVFQPPKDSRTFTLAAWALVTRSINLSSFAILQ